MWERTAAKSNWKEAFMHDASLLDLGKGDCDYIQLLISIQNQSIIIIYIMMKLTKGKR